jgi:Cu+-exporting ATPase
MTCAGCVQRVSEALRAVPGVKGVEVDATSGRATVTWAAAKALDTHPLLQAVEHAGYKAALASATSVPEHAPADGWKLNLLLGAALTLPLMLGEWVLNFGHERWFHWLAFIQAGVVQAVCGARFYRGAWQQARVGASNMDTLVALGTTTAYGYSTWQLFTGAGAHLFFLESAATLTFISLGHWLEARISQKAEQTLRSLLDLAPPTAHQLDARGHEAIVPIAQLRVGDRILLRPGDRVPTDAKVLEGASAVDESMFTGESLPAEKRSGAGLYTGTTLLNGQILARVTATGEATALAHIITIVRRAQSSRTNIQRLGDCVSNVFVPIVVALALAAGLWWGLAPDSARATHALLAPFLWPAHLPPETISALTLAILHACAVLIVACPCAMGLATPAAIMAGTNAAARRGILIRDGVALEKTGRINAVLFDKTGTLTEGRPAVAAIEDLRPPEERAQNLSHLAAALARPSLHPLSQAIVRHGADASRAGRNAPPAFTDWREQRGCGVQASGDGELWRLGSVAWLRELGVNLAAGEPFIVENARRGTTILALARGPRLTALIGLRDHLKPGSVEIIKRLQRQGLAIHLVSGDNAQTAAAVAREVGIPEANVFAETRPEAKADLVARLQQSGQRVAFVGDGINDAPALEQADLGIAVSRASDVAREAADIILLTSDVQAIPGAIGLARATLRVIRQNLFWAFFYNAAALPLAALGFLSPVVCAATMAASDLVVIGNALRLRNWKE